MSATQQSEQTIQATLRQKQLRTDELQHLMQIQQQLAFQLKEQSRDKQKELDNLLSNQKNLSSGCFTA